jgi:chorismate synthase
MMNKIRYLTAGESHGPAITVIIDGLPAGMCVAVNQINQQLKKRQGGYGRGGRMKIESDQVTVLAGIRFGKTLGSPVCLEIHNKDWKNWDKVMSADPADESGEKSVTAPRPGHTDLAGGIKYQHKDLRNVLERSSARETTMRVAAGALVRQLLEACGIQVYGYVTKIGGVSVAEERPAFEILNSILDASECRSFDPQVDEIWIKKIDEARKAGDSLGGLFEVVCTGVPIGLGSHVQWDRKLEGRLAQAVMSIQAVKAVEIGLGVGVADKPGSQVHDEIFYEEERGFYHETNRAGGLTGGVTNGAPIVVRGALKPIATLYTPLRSVDITTKKEHKASIERSDICVLPAASVIAENVVALEIADAFLEKFGGDSMEELQRNYQGYLEQVKGF